MSLEAINKRGTVFGGIKYNRCCELVQVRGGLFLNLNSHILLLFLSKSLPECMIGTLNITQPQSFLVVDGRLV